MTEFIDAIVKHVAAGGSGIAWPLCAYLLWRLHQVTDRQHTANLDTVKALTTIRTVLCSRVGMGDME